jgi:hypothetical protein
MRETAGYSARLTELASCCTASRRHPGAQYTRIRTQQVERFLAELDRQFKIASRLVEVMRQDLELIRSQRMTVEPRSSTPRRRDGTWVNATGLVHVDGLPDASTGSPASSPTG